MNIITLIFPINKIHVFEGQFLADGFLEAL